MVGLPARGKSLIAGKGMIDLSTYPQSGLSPFHVDFSNFLHSFALLGLGRYPRQDIQRWPV